MLREDDRNSHVQGLKEEERKATITITKLRSAELQHPKWESDIHKVYINEYSCPAPYSVQLCGHY